MTTYPTSVYIQPEETSVTQQYLTDHYYDKSEDQAFLSTKLNLSGGTMSGDLLNTTKAGNFFTVSVATGSFTNVFATNLTVSGTVSYPSPGQVQTLFLNYSVASDLGGAYKQLSFQPAGAVEQKVDVAVIDTDTWKAHSSFATAFYSPNLETINPGSWQHHITASVDDITLATSMRVKVYQTTTGTLLGTTASVVLTASAVEYNMPVTIAGFDYTPASDRILFVVEISTADTSSRTVSVYFEGATKTALCFTPISTFNAYSMPTLQITSPVQSTSTSSGALQVSAGGVGVSGNL